MMSVKNDLDVLELNDKEISPSERETVRVVVSSHWNRDDLVVLHIRDLKVTVVAEQLEKAIKNARNWR